MNSPAEWGAIGFGVLLIANGILWRRLHRRRARRDLVARLSDPDPAVRLAALDGLTAADLRRHAAALEELAQAEREPAVLEALARVVLRHESEPAVDPSIVQLRTWAADRRLAAIRPAVPPPAFAEPAAPPVPAPAVFEPVPPPVPAEGPRVAEAPLPGVGAAEPAEPAEPAVHDQAGSAREVQLAWPPASPELLAASRPVAESLAQVLGTTVRGLRIITREGVVTAQWPK